MRRCNAVLETPTDKRDTTGLATAIVSPRDIVTGWRDGARFLLGHGPGRCGARRLVRIPPTPGVLSSPRRWPPCAPAADHRSRSPFTSTPTSPPRRLPRHSAGRAAAALTVHHGLTTARAHGLTAMHAIRDALTRCSASNCAAPHFSAGGPAVTGDATALAQGSESRWTGSSLSCAGKRPAARFPSAGLSPLAPSAVRASYGQWAGRSPTTQKGYADVRDAR
jgi:hypothetical protein